MPTLLALLLLIPLNPTGTASEEANASGGVLIPEQAAFEVEHYSLDLCIDPEKKTIAGSLTMRAMLTGATKRIALDLEHRLSIASLAWNGEEARFEHEGDRVWIPVPASASVGDRFEVTVVYAGTPRVAPRPPWKGGFTWKTTRDGSPWIATSCQGEGADLWWPCKDHPSDKPETMDLFITVPSELYCATNGSLVSNEKNADGTRTFHWHISNPISNYNVALNIAPYTVLEREYESVTGEVFNTFFYALPEHADKAEYAFPRFLEHLRFYEEVLGPYPFRNEKYGIVETPHLGMEHQTIIAYGNGYKLEEDGYDWLHHHELGHEWWGNLVTCRDWKDMWIHEGICTYMQALYMERTRGKEAYLKTMRGTRVGLQNKGPVAPRETKNSHEIYFRLSGNDIYSKGSWIMHSLRWVLGDEDFFAALRRMAYPDPKKESVTDGSQVRFSDTEQIRAIAENVYGKDLGWFFEVYLRQGALPTLVETRKGKSLNLAWDTPQGLPFPMPIEVEIDGERQRVEMTRGSVTLTVGKDSTVKVDPDDWILRSKPRRAQRKKN